MLSQGPWLGVDLGGTAMKSLLLSRGLITEQHSEPTVRSGAENTIHALAALVEGRMAQHPEIVGVGITLPGLFDEVGRATVIPNIPGEWPGVPVREIIAERGGRPTTLINDARAFGLAELHLGAARAAQTAVGTVLGTGIGGVVIVNGKLHLGSDGGAGELGHQVLEPDGPLCGCGNRGCLEALACAAALAADAGYGSVRLAAQAARAGDAQAAAAFIRAGHYLGHGLANVVTVLQPEVIFVGGGVAAAGPLIIEPLAAELARLTPLVAKTSYRVALAELGPWAGAAGAALAAATPAAGT